MSSIITVRAQTLAQYKDEIGWYRIPDTETISKQTFFAVYGNELGLGTLDEMELLECITDEFENEHCRYAQHYDGVGVEYTHFLRHSVGDKVYLAYGKLVNSENCTGSFTLTEAEALSAALDYLAWDSYLWESSDAETALKVFMEDDNATYYPVGKKIWANTSLDGSAESYRPAYYFYIPQTETSGLYIYVDAETSTIIKSFVPGVEEPLLFTDNHITEIDCEDNILNTTQIASNCHNGTISPTNFGSRIIDTYNRPSPNSDFILKDECRGINSKWAIQTLGINMFGSFSNISQNNNLNWSGDGANAHWAVQESWDYFGQKINRWGTDGNKKQLGIQVGVANLGSSGVFIPNTNSNDLIRLSPNLARFETVSHEYTHGISHHFWHPIGTATLVDERSLDEGLSDIFAELLEWNLRGFIDYIHGTGAPTGFFVRNFANPSLSTIPQPSTYLTDPNWANNISVNVNVNGVIITQNLGNHVNNGVLLHWFYLLANPNGGSQNGQTVSSIGLSKMEKILLNTFQYIPDNANYVQFRAASIQATIAIYGFCSNEVTQVLKAWHAVGCGLSNQTPCIAFNNTLKGGLTYCNSSTINRSVYTNLAGNVTYNWSAVTANTIIPNGSQAAFSGFSVPSAAIYVSATNGTNTTPTISQTFATQNCRLANPDLISIETANIYPNPTDNTCYITLPEGLSADMILMDLQGKIIEKRHLCELITEINTQHISSGIYLAKLQLSNGTINTLKIAIQH